MATYTVKKGDTLGKIAKSLGLSGWQDLYNLNKNLIGSNPNLIKPGQVLQLPSGAKGGDSGGGGGSTGGGATGSKQPEALPRGAKLVRWGSVHRVVWNLGGGLGWAWYTISGDQLKKIYGNATPPVDEVFNSKDAFHAKYGHIHFGNVAEINLKNDDPWQDLKDRIFNQFGWVPGFDDPSIKRLLIQAYFEDWSQNQWLVEYRKTDFYQKSTDAQRQWAGLSQAEKNQRIRDQRVDLANRYRDIWGTGISTGDADLQDAALKIASGQMTLDQWDFQQRNAARKQEGTPEWRRERDEQRARREEGNRIENLTLFAEEQWREWVGPGAPPGNFAKKWGQDLASGKASEADLQQYLKSISNGRWQHKPPDITWQDWASAYKGQIRNTLELGSLDDNDPLLSRILGQDPSGMDLDQLIRQDARYRSTQGMYRELSSSVEDVGRRFGFIT